MFCATPDSSSLNEPVLQEQVEKLNRQNAEYSHVNAEAEAQRGEDRGRQEPAELILEGPDTSAIQTEERKREKEREEEEEEGDIFQDSEPEADEEKGEDVSAEPAGAVEDDGKKRHKAETVESEKSQSIITDINKTSLLPKER